MKLRSAVPALLFMLAVSAGLTHVCLAQQRDDSVTIVSHVDIIPDAYKPKSEEDAARLLRNQAAATQQDAGLVSYVILQQNGESNHFTIVETWRDARSYELHQGAVHTIRFRNEIQPFLGSPFDSREHRRFR